MKDYDGINFDEIFQDNENFEDFMKSMKQEKNLNKAI